MLSSQQRPQILIIEHDPWRRTDVAAQLAGAGYTVRVASNGFSGLRLARNAPPDAIVLGAQLAEVAATDLQEQLGDQAQTRAIPVIPLSVDGGTGSVAADLQRVLIRFVTS